MWMMMAWLSAICSAGSTILAKHGIRKTDSTLATALRTGVVLVCAWAMAGMESNFGTALNWEKHIMQNPDRAGEKRG